MIDDANVVYECGDDNYYCRDDFKRVMIYQIKLLSDSILSIQILPL